MFAHAHHLLSGAQKTAKKCLPFWRVQATEEIAIAHDYLTQRGGAERVVLAMHKAFPEATIYTTLYDPEGTFPEFKDAKIVTSGINRIGLFRHKHRFALPLLPFASSLLKVPARKAIISTTGWAHGFRYAGQSFVYCHSPARWLYLSDQYLGKKKDGVAGIALRTLSPALKLWDQRAAAKSENYVGNSTIIRERIKNVYGKEDVPIFFPPHSVDMDSPAEPIPGLEKFMADGDYFLIVSRLLPYKNIEHAVEAFTRMGKKLLIIGRGPEKDSLLKHAGPTVRIASDLPDAQLCYAYRNCVALLAISHEDFGITPLEAGASGKPVIAFRAGGFLDTVVEGRTGVFIDEPTPELIESAVSSFDPAQWDPQQIRAHVEKFSEERFISQLHEYVAQLG